MEGEHVPIHLSDLLSDQQQDFESLKRHTSSLRTLLDQDRPEAIFKHRAEYIRHLWVRCQERNAQIYRAASEEEKVDLSYFTAVEFGNVETLVFEALDAIAERTPEHQDQSLQPTGQPGTGRTELYTGLSSVKLPRINLITFSGLFTEWQTFRHTFISLVKNNTALDAIAKLHYLRGSLAGDALDIISHIDITAVNFEIAWELILKQYDNKIVLVTAHLNALFSVEPIKKESSQSLSALRHSIKKHLGALKSLGRNTDGYDDIFINRVAALLDPRTKRNWELLLAAKLNYPNYEDLDNFLLERIRALESLSCLPDTLATTSQAVSKSKTKANSQSVRSYLKTLL